MKVVYSSKFKKDLKRYQNQPHKIRALGEVIKHLKKHGRVQKAGHAHLWGRAPLSFSFSFLLQQEMFILTAAAA